MKITVLDRCTLTAGDLDFSALDRLGQVAYYDLVPSERLPEVIRDSEAVLVNKAVIDRQVMDACPALRYVGLFATGYNNIDLKAAEEKGICVCNVPGYSTPSVAQQVFAFILAYATSLPEYDRSTHNGDWITSHTFSYFPYPVSELAGKTLGIFGYGAIGRKVAEIGRAFDMEILVCTRTPPKDCPDLQVTMEVLFRRSDYLTFHCPLTPLTKELVCKQTLSWMKPTAYLINTARGGIVVEQDLADALNAGEIAGAGIDVLTVEPMRANQPLLKAKNCRITPHMAWASAESRQRLLWLVCENLRQFQAGTPIHQVFPEM